MNLKFEENGAEGEFRPDVKGVDAPTSEGNVAGDESDCKEVYRSLETSEQSADWFWWEGVIWKSQGYKYPQAAEVMFFHRLVKTSWPASGVWRFECEACGREFTFAKEPPKWNEAYECATHLAEGVDDKGMVTVCWRRPKEARFFVPCRLDLHEIPNLTPAALISYLREGKFLRA